MYFLKVRNIDLPLKVKRKSHTEKRKQNKQHLVKIPSRNSDAVRVGLEKISELYGESFETVFKSITSDNGSEFVDLGEARTKSKTLLSLAFSQRESHWITLPMNKLPRKIFNYHSSDFIFQSVLFDIAI